MSNPAHQLILQWRNTCLVHVVICAIGLFVLTPALIGFALGRGLSPWPVATIVMPALAFGFVNLQRLLALSRQLKGGNLLSTHIKKEVP